MLKLKNINPAKFAGFFITFNLQIVTLLEKQNHKKN